MKVTSIQVHDFRAFQDQTTLNIGQCLTAISGLNGLGKTTLLAVLANIGEIKSKTFKLINGKPFRGDFADVVIYDPKNDDSKQWNDTKKIKIFFSDIPNNTDYANVLTFRATIQKRAIKTYTYQKEKNSQLYLKKSKGTTILRYRLIPEKTATRKKEAKLSWPCYYIGLSRLSPIGEASSTKTKKISKEISDKTIGIYNQLMNDHISPETSLVEAVVLDSSSKNKVGIDNPKYSATSNSNGQDNLTQLIQAVLSFEELKQKLGDDYYGGLLAIDELDAALHPAVQINLVNWLFKMSKSIGLQVVFTTHSISLLEAMTKLRLSKGAKEGQVIVDHLVKDNYQNSKIKIKENPTLDFITKRLKNEISVPGESSKTINVLTEDSTARWFLELLIQSETGKVFPELKKLNLLELDISWNHLVKLISSDYDTFKNLIVILDPDMRGSLKDSFNKLIDDLPYIGQVDKAGASLLILPGNYSIEKQIYEYLMSLNDDHAFYNDSDIGDAGIYYDPLHNGIEYQLGTDKKESTNYKNWAKDHRFVFKKAVNYWINDNSEEVELFLKNLNQTFMKINNSIN